MNIQTKRLNLVEISWDDLNFVHDFHSVPEVDEFNTLGIPKDLHETRSVLKSSIEDQQKSKRSQFCWKIVVIETNETIGLAGMFLSNDRFKMGEFYYKLYPKYWGNGYATETAQAIIQFGFEEFNLHRIEAGVATKNLASIRVLVKVGMICEGVRRKILPIRGVWKDNFHYAIVEDDYFKMNSYN